MRILFAGTPEFAVPSLNLLSDVFPVVGVLTAPPRPRGRGRKAAPSPVNVAAESRSIPVLTPERLGAEARRNVAALRPDILVCVAYGRIFGPRFLAVFPYGGINLHPSLLPRHRGPAPIPATILAGDRKAGITVQKLAREMDAGDILLQEERTLDGSETTGVLTDEIARRGAELLVEAVRDIAAGRAVAQEQDHSRATYCGLIQSSDAEIDWSESAAVIERKVRAYNPWPKAYTWFRRRRLSLLEAAVVEDEAAVAQQESSGAGGRAGGSGPTGVAGPSGGDSDGSPGAGTAPGTIVGMDSNYGILVQTGTGLLALLKIQPQNKKVMSWRDFINGVGDITGEAFKVHRE